MREPARKRWATPSSSTRTVSASAAQPLVAVADVAGPALGVDLADPDEQVDMRIVGAVREFDDRVPVHEQIMGEGRAGERQHVFARREPAVVAVAAVRRQQRAAGGGRRVGGVVAESRRWQLFQLRGRRLAQVAAGSQIQRVLDGGGRPVGDVVPALSGDADADPCGPAQRCATQVGIEPVQRVAHTDGQALGEQLPVRPRPDGERDVDTASAQAAVLLQRLPHEDVLPAAHQQHRHAHAVQRLVEPHRIPEWVGAVGVFDPGFEPRGAAAQQRLRTGAQRQLRRRLGDPAWGPQLADRRPDALRILLVDDQVAPAQEVAEGERAGIPDRGSEVVRAGRDHGRGQFRGRIL